MLDGPVKNVIVLKESLKKIGDLRKHQKQNRRDENCTLGLIKVCS
jgi:ribosomal protein S15P/S13E